MDDVWLKIKSIRHRHGRRWRSEINFFHRFQTSAVNSAIKFTLQHNKLFCCIFLTVLVRCFLHVLTYCSVNYSRLIIHIDVIVFTFIGRVKRKNQRKGAGGGGDEDED
jgi:hypothetical protein